jgi:hypothetical protein
MFSLFGLSIQEFLISLFYCQRTAFVCEFQHTPLRKMIFFLNTVPKSAESHFGYLCPSGVNIPACVHICSFPTKL